MRSRGELTAYTPWRACHRRVNGTCVPSPSRPDRAGCAALRLVDGEGAAGRRPPFLLADKEAREHVCPQLRQCATQVHVIILGAICMLISSWKSSLHAYGTKTCEMRVLFRQPRHSKVPLLRLAIAIMPQMSHTWMRKASDASKRRSLRMEATPCEIMQSRSISPKRRPPSRARPSIGCRVSRVTGPRAREWILSSTICLSRW
mmetsp:Transcript_19783/g.45567  ORF Transcript_19783/g.45567 Transcript_19783/m.45567 type:complete len:203 (-) Transcript_19783:1677-2285(-)